MKPLDRRSFLVSAAAGSALAALPRLSAQPVTASRATAPLKSGDGLERTLLRPFSALNPKNVLLTVAAAAEIAGVGIPAGQQAAVLLGFVLLASAGVLTPLALSLALGDEAVRQEREVERHAAPLRGALDRREVVGKDRLCVVEEAADQRALAVVDAAERDEAQHSPVLDGQVFELQK